MFNVRTRVRVIFRMSVSVNIGVDTCEFSLAPQTKSALGHQPIQTGMKSGFATHTLIIGISRSELSSLRPEVKCILCTCGPDLRTGKGLGLVLRFMLMVSVRVRVSIRVKIKVRVSSSILPYCWSAGLVHRSAVYILPMALHESGECRCQKTYCLFHHKNKCFFFPLTHCFCFNC